MEDDYLNRTHGGTTCCTANIKWQSGEEIVEDAFRLSQEQADELMKLLQSPAADAMVVVPTSEDSTTWLAFPRNDLIFVETIWESTEAYTERTRWHGLSGRGLYEAMRRHASKATQINQK